MNVERFANLATAVIVIAIIVFAIHMVLSMPPHSQRMAQWQEERFNECMALETFTRAECVELVSGD